MSRVPLMRAVTAAEMRGRKPGPNEYYRVRTGQTRYLVTVGW